MSNKVKIFKNDNSNTRVAKKSFISKIRRKHKTYVNKIPNESKINYHNSPIKFQDYIEGFCKINKVYEWKIKPSVVKFDKNFSLFVNPNEVLKSLLILLYHAKTIMSKKPKLVFKGHVAFGSLYLIDNLCWEIGKKRRWVIDHQTLPDDEVKILRSLKSVISSNFEDNDECLINETVRINRNLDPGANQRYKVVGTDMTNMLQKAISEIKGVSYQLPKEIYHGVSSTIGEQFDNICQHSIITEHGTICGFYNKKLKEITLLVFNFGETILETFVKDGNNTPDELIQLFKDIYEAQNTDKVNFDRKLYERIVTLCSIQEGISSKLTEDNTRGYGFLDFMKSVFDISDLAEIAIISRNTAIKIDNTYKFNKKNFFGKSREIMAFNDENNLYLQPNSDFVRSLDIKFPGVIIETKIPLYSIFE